MSINISSDYFKSSESLEDIIALMPGYVYWKNKYGVLLGCNNEQAKFIGLKSRYDSVGLTAVDSLPYDFAEKITLNDKEVMKTGISTAVEEVLTLPDGTLSIWLSKKTPLFDNQNKVIGLLGISFAEEELYVDIYC